MSRRSAIQTQLVTILTAASGINSVSNITTIEDDYPEEFLQAELPAIRLFYNNEVIQYKASQRAMNEIRMDLYLYMVEWSKTSLSQEEQIIQKIRNAVGANLTLNNTCVDISIKNINKLNLKYPIVAYRMNISILYEESISNL